MISICGEVGRAESALGRQADMVDGARVEADDGAAHRVERDLVVPHDDEIEGEWPRGQHPPLARDDRVDGDELRLDDVLEVGDLLVEAVIVVDETVSVVLDPDVILHREGDGRPRVRLELRRVDEVVRLGDRLRHEDVVAQPVLVGVPDLDLRLFLEAVSLHATGASDDAVEPAVLERVPGGDGDAAPLADGELGHRVAADVLQRQEEPLAELGPRVRVRKHVARRHEVRLHQRAAARHDAELAHAVPQDGPDALGKVTVAVADDDARG